MIYFTLVNKEKGDVDCKDTVYRLKWLRCSSTCVSPVLYVHGHSQRPQFYGGQLFMESSWERERARATEAHCAWVSIVVCLNSQWIWCMCWLHLSLEKEICVQTFLLTKENGNLNVSDILLVTSGLVESECMNFSEQLFFFTEFCGFNI